LNRPVPTEKQLAMTWKILDTNRDGEISYREMELLLEDLISIIMNEFDLKFAHLLDQEM